MEKIEIIEINGRRYDAVTGRPVDEQPKRHVPVVSHTKASHKQASTNHVPRHAPATSKLLMRKAVKKPAPGLKRRIKVSGALEAREPSSDLSPVRRTEKRLTHAKQIPKSQLVNHFTSQPSNPYPADTVFQGASAKVTVRSVTPAQPKHSLNAEELLDRALREATAHEQKPLPKSRRRLLRPRNRLFAKAHAA